MEPLSTCPGFWCETPCIITCFPLAQPLCRDCFIYFHFSISHRAFTSLLDRALVSRGLRQEWTRCVFFGSGSRESLGVGGESLTWCRAVPISSDKPILCRLKACSLQTKEHSGRNAATSNWHGSQIASDFQSENLLSSEVPADCETRRLLSGM